ncbi:MAG TPA: cupin domain-containing protein [Catenuloplanes sp.]|jgi:gentisate 1,2-dioxygenase
MRILNLAQLGSGLHVAGYAIASGGVATIAPGKHSHPEGHHVHPDPEVFLVLTGRGRIHIDGTPTPFAAGDVLVVEPGEDHHLHCAGPDPVVVTWLHLEGDPMPPDDAGPGAVTGGSDEAVVTGRVPAGD